MVLDCVWLCRSGGEHVVCPDLLSEEFLLSPVLPPVDALPGSVRLSLHHDGDAPVRGADTICPVIKLYTIWIKGLHFIQDLDGDLVRPPGACPAASGPDWSDGQHLPDCLHQCGEIRHCRPSLLQGRVSYVKF